MWKYQKMLQYPVNIKTPSAANAKLVLAQLGGPDGEMGAAARYLNQRYVMPYNETKGILTDIGTEVSVLPPPTHKPAWQADLCHEKVDMQWVDTDNRF